MKCLSFNCRGQANLDKKLALKRLCLSEKLDIIFLQEILEEGSLVNNLLLKFLPDWVFHCLDVRGCSGGCAMGFNKRTIKIQNVWGGGVSRR